MDAGGPSRSQPGGTRDRAQRRKEQQKASCMCWFPAGAGGKRELSRQRHSARAASQPQDSVVATLGYDLRHDPARTDFKSTHPLGPQWPVFPPAMRNAELESPHSSPSSSSSAPHALPPLGDPVPVLVDAASDTAFREEQTDRREAEGRDRQAKSSLSEFSVRQAPLSQSCRLSPAAPEEEEDEDDYQITDIPLEIASSPSTMTCASVLIPSTMVLRPSLRPTGDPPMHAELKGARRDPTDTVQSMTLALAPALSPPKSRALPQRPGRPSVVMAQPALRVGLKILPPAVKGFTGALSPVPHSHFDQSGWSSVEDSGDDTDWVKPIFDDPTVVIAARGASDRWPEQGARRMGAQDLQDTLARKELEESHGFFTSSSNPFSSSPVPQERPSAMMSAASTHKNASYDSNHSVAQHQDSHVPGGSDRFFSDAGRPRQVSRKTSLAQRRVSGDTSYHGEGRLQSAGSTAIGTNDRPPSPCLRPGTLKNLTSAFEDHIRRVQEPLKDTPRRLALKPSGRVGSLEVVTSETLRKRIESDLRMLSISDDENSSSGSSPRDRRRDYNDGLLC